MSIGERIMIARKAKALSQRNLAQLAHISAMSISKYERGENNPSSEILIRIAYILEENIEFFFRSSPKPVSLVLYRKHADIGKKVMNSIQANIQDWLERYLQIEMFISDLQNEKFLLPTFKISSIEEAEDAAEKLRKEWQLGVDPIDNITEVLESRGVKIGLVDAIDGFDACTFRYDDKHVIVVRKNIPGDRQRFNIAHELGHNVLQVNEEDKEESASYRFAGAFLFPRNAVFQELGKKRSKLGLNELYSLKNKYGISMQAIIYRAKDLNIIKKTTYKKLFKNFTLKGYRKVEPGDQYPSEKPMRMERFLNRLLSEEIITVSRAEELNKGKITEIGGYAIV